ncbi:hypothetical protein ACFFTN_01440 [Aminobacter aganoensis]|uniref:Uncharacterized protein n=1 Tax=Aminobacter aganoensis TaxID=83264 RepID=A0A7X0F5I1_9HYPH|nr:hypothetical protein [Aminobacter aganoensis]MBB6353477.1 hypothetical protein [Aminobacter aganoensis]
MALTNTVANQAIQAIRNGSLKDLADVLKALVNGDFNYVGGTAVTATAAEINRAADATGFSQELTATAAVTAGVKNLRLNHATVVIAATFTPSPGLFTVTDTSASGTAAHTLTLGGGATFNGTNTIATLNAPAESLVVFFDEALVGNVVVNTGSVALS